VTFSDLLNTSKSSVPKISELLKGFQYFRYVKGINYIILYAANSVDSGTGI
jgi:hypothetical protein